MTDRQTPSGEAASRRFPARRSLAPLVATLLLLSGIAADRALLKKPSLDTETYHNRVQASAASVPLLNGMWMGTDISIPQGAVALLKPNVIVSRRYEEIGTGRHLQLLFVQCKDARDIIGHYPPVCYPGQGWVEIHREEADWRLGDATITGMRYHFMTPQRRTVTVENFMALPSGHTARNMDAVERAAQDSSQKYFGAAQVQLVYDTDLSVTEREETFSSFIGMLRPLLDQIMRLDSAAETGEPRA